MLIPERMLRHLLETGEYEEDRQAGTITVYYNAKESDTAHVDNVWTELMNFIKVMNEKAGPEDVEGLEGLFVSAKVMSDEEVRLSECEHGCKHDHDKK